MIESKYYLVFFDYDRENDAERKIIRCAMNDLFSEYYKNRSLIISQNVLLIKLSIEDSKNHISPQSFVDEAINEQINKQDYFFSDSINIFVLPVELDSIIYFTKKFEKELEYINSKD